MVQASVHPRAIVDTVAHLFEVFKDDARLLELLAPLHDVTAHLVESVTDEPFLEEYLWGGGFWEESYYVGMAGDVSTDTIEQYIERTEHV